MLGNIEEFLLETEPQIETLIKTLSASPADAAIAPSAYMQLVELFNKVRSQNYGFFWTKGEFRTLSFHKFLE